MKPKSKRFWLVLGLSCLTLLLCGISIIIAGVQSVYAATKSRMFNFSGSENITHTVSSFTSNAATRPTDYTETKNITTGIKVYSENYSGETSSSNAPVSATSNVYIDFTSAAALYYPSTATSHEETSYVFQILSGSNVIWYAKFSTTTSIITGATGTPPSYSYYKVINVNGTTRHISSSSANVNICNLSDFGKNLINLSEGKYQISITRKYMWTKPVSSSNTSAASVSYSSTSTLQGTLAIDLTSPTLTMTSTSSGNRIASGTKTNGTVKFQVSDANPYRIYYKTPSMSSYTFTSSSSYTTGTTNGWYYVYAVDCGGNQSEVYSIYYDNVKPTGTIYSNGSSVSSGAYISKSFSYSATDNGSGIKKLYYKTPVSGTYLEYTSGSVIPANSGDGWYYFYAVDNAGNVSDTKSVYLETQAPQVGIYRNGTLSYSKSLTGSGNYDTDIYLKPNDTFKVTCVTSSGNATCNYSLNTNIKIDGNFANNSYTITITSATGIKGNFTIHIVHSKPTFTVGGKSFNSGAVVYLKSDTPVSWLCDSAITNKADTGARIVSEGNTSINEFVAFKNGNSRTLTTANGTVTKYTLTVNDRAGNESRITVYIDKQPPTGTWSSNGKTISNGGYTNKPLSFRFTESGVTATYSKNGGEYLPYSSGTVLTSDGTYNIILVDLAGNKSTFTAHLDTVCPVGQLYADYKAVQSGTITNGTIYFTWDGEITATVNGAPYTKNTMLTGDARYQFILTDFANNSTEYVITIDTAAPKYNQDKLDGYSKLKSKWYLVNIDDSLYSFPTYEDALAFASTKEYEKYVTELILDDIADFNQHHLVADNGSAENTDDDVRVGAYWLYKSKANPETLLYYFDRNLLNEVVAYYAKASISEKKYFLLGGENEYGSVSENMSDNKLMAYDGTVAPALNGFVFDKVDGVELFAELVGGNGSRIKLEYGVSFDEQISIGGLYKLIELDAARNETVFYGIYDVSAPELRVAATIFGNTETTDISISADSILGIAAYYYESFAIREIIDADKWSVLTITNDSNTLYYTFGDELPCLNKGGEYMISLYDRFGNSFSFTVYIVGNPAVIEFNNNADDTAFDLSITLEQKFDTLVSVEIRRNGVLLANISTEKFNYTFDKAGIYTVKLRDNFGRVIEKEYCFIKALPSGVLEGVENGGKTKNDVNFTYDNSIYYIFVTKDGKVIDFASSGAITINANDATSGNYVIRIIRLTDDENYSEYSFCINTLKPEFELSVADGATTNKNVSVSWSQDDIVQVTYSLNGGEAIALANDTVLTAEGSYLIQAINDLGTVSEKSFVIDKTLDYYVAINEQKVTNAEATNETVAIFNNEPLYITVTKNGEAYAYDFGTIISEEGYYNFHVFDDYNNAVSFGILVDKSVSYKSNVGNGMITNEDVSFTNGEKLTITVMKDNSVIDYTFGQLLTEEGMYKAVLKDSYGNEKTVSFRIVKSIKNVLDYTLGEDVEVISVEHNGQVISATDNRLKFTEDGEYRITAISEGETYTFTLSLDATAPEIELSGVENGKTTNSDVVVSWADTDVKSVICKFNGKEATAIDSGAIFTAEGKYEIFAQDVLGNESSISFTIDKTLDFEIKVSGTKVSEINRTNKQVVFVNNELLHITVTKNGANYEYAFGNAITAEGYYEITVFDDYNNSVILKFEIDKTVSEILLDGAESGKTTNADVVVSWQSKDIKSVVCKYNGGEALAIENGAVFSAEGTYEIIVTDDLGNTSKVTFAIDKTLDFEIQFGGENAGDNDRTNKEVVLIKNEELHIVVNKDGEQIDYGFGQSLTEEGKYEIRIFDDFNNVTEITIIIDKTAPTIILNGVEDGGIGYSKVTITDMSESGTVEVYKNGERIEYELGDKLDDYATYEIKVIDDLGNERTYSFTLEYRMPGIFIALIVVACVAVVGVGVFFILKKKKIIK